MPFIVSAVTAIAGAISGVLAAGGIGAALVQSINSRRWSMVGAFLFGMIVLMLFIELFSTKVRKKLARG